MEEEQKDTVPHDFLSDQARKNAAKQLKEKKKEYFSQLGKKSAAKRKKDGRFGKKYYSELAKRSAAAKRAKKNKNAAPLPPFKMPESPIHTINKFLKGDF